MKTTLFTTLVLIFFIGYFFTNPILANHCPTGSLATQDIRVNDGFLTITDPSKLAQYSVSGASGTTGCISDSRAVLPKFSIPNYEDVRSIYYNQTKIDPLLITKEQKIGNWEFKDLPLATTPFYMYNVTGDLNITYDATGNKVVVVFVDGNLNINPVNSANKFTYSATDTNGGVMFVVNGDVRVATATREINAFIVTFGTFCSAWDTTNLSCLPNATAEQLVINGSIINMKDTKPPKFGRNLAGEADSTTPAERIVYQPRYLAILKDIFSRDLTIWQEIH